MQICRIDAQTTRFDPVEAEITVTVELDTLCEDVKLRGRLMGPKNVYAETVELAYPLKPIPADGGVMRAKVVIPEANAWEPIHPFLYEGPVELWRGSEKVETSSVAHGLRDLRLIPRGLRLNGAPIRLLGYRTNSLSEDEARRLHAAGCNLIIGRASQSSELWEIADRFGFLTIGQLAEDDEDAVWFAEQHLCGRPSCLGWVFPQSILSVRQMWHSRMAMLSGRHRNILHGVRVEEPHGDLLQGEVSFVICDEAQLPELGDNNLFKLVVTRKSAREVGELPPARDILGWICREF